MTNYLSVNLSMYVVYWINTMYDVWFTYYVPLHRMFHYIRYIFVISSILTLSLDSIMRQSFIFEAGDSLSSTFSCLSIILSIFWCFDQLSRTLINSINFKRYYINSCFSKFNTSISLLVATFSTEIIVHSSIFDSEDAVSSTSNHHSLIS